MKDEDEMLPSVLNERIFTFVSKFAAFYVYEYWIMVTQTTINSKGKGEEFSLFFLLVALFIFS